jgi:hypothetical protein
MLLLSTCRAEYSPFYEFGNGQHLFAVKASVDLAQVTRPGSGWVSRW